MQLQKAIAIPEKETHCQEKNENHCDGDEDCACCKKHGSYTIKENIKPDDKFQILEFPETAENNGYLVSYIYYPFETNAKAWPNSNSPPYVLKESLYISFRSLLI